MGGSSEMQMVTAGAESSGAVISSSVKRCPLYVLGGTLKNEHKRIWLG